MTFRNLTVKECFDNPKTAAVVKELAPNLLKYPIKLFNKKSCGEIFDLVVSKKILPADTAKKIEEEINKLL
ncbi:MAG: hypothetical protein IJL51_05395 [Oscillospiraceae bacterium]|jgi:hypothetical protein|nr:hypothetical protein [Oscillospiraceae bacterium]